MNIFFDVDSTILGMDNSLRPGTVEIFRRLTEEGHHIYIWSGVGIRWMEVRQHGLERFVTDCFIKPTEQYVERARSQGLPVWPDLVIDDHTEVCEAFGGISIRPYFFYNPQDEEMACVYGIISEFALTGSSLDVRFRSPNGHQ